MTPEATVIETLFRIPTKEGVDVDFLLNPHQRRLDARLTGRDLVPKARQLGFSSYVLARFTVKCLSRNNTRAVVISHDIESTQRQLSRVKYYLANIRGPGPVVEHMSKNEITFPKTNSMFYIGTAGARKFGRGDTITDLHCSEYAFWPNAPQLISGLFQAVPKSGEIIIESTGNGMNDYYRRCMRAFEGNSRWGLHFFPWHNEPEYSLDLMEEEIEELYATLDRDLNEPDLTKILSAQQLAWRRWKLADEFDYDLREFRQEYPMTLDECFQAPGGSVFYRVNYEATDRWREREPKLYVLEGHPHKDKAYALGADVGAGVEQNASAVEVFCVDDGEQVAEYVDNKIAPDVFADKVCAIGAMFGHPLAVVEQNNHGLVTLSYMRGKYPAGKIYQERSSINTQNRDRRLLKMGWKTTARTRPIMIGELRKRLADDVIIHSPVLRSELSTFIEHENGDLAAAPGCRDDTVIAAACALVRAQRAVLLGRKPKREVPKTVDPFSLEAIIQERHSGRNQFAIRGQALSDWIYED